MNLYIIFLRFAAQRAQAGSWMAGHKQWLQQGLADGVFLMAGSLEGGQGGLVIATGRDRGEIDRRVRLDPFVAQGVVAPEVHAVTPSVLSAGMSAMLKGDQALGPAT